MTGPSSKAGRAGTASPAKRLVIAVDGPAAAGKGTLAQALAQFLGLPYLDTGLFYRATARLALDAGAPLEEAVRFAEQLEGADLVRPDLRTPDVDQAASFVARQPKVRAALLQRQRDFAAATGAVLDGRDIGTVVLPDADVKFFVTASPEERARRRYRQRHGCNPQETATLAAEVEAIKQRDSQDENRATAPLRPAVDAHHIMTDGLDAAGVLKVVVAHLEKRGLLDPT
ncbi:(d)CMP kinase [Formicincola oecophyllae]|uniref:Cytidylate kinase n=1 Tax=Formicincola oecophyllae TaxID=2558361 RepID=A0A4Y6U8E8_9PROT|nr:(d)CMP kinase [Formicincola oecophyllae]QDH13642.1 (d)CMP kinase [Formicincola oecophyllae]